jgi:hypothetical protein
MVLPRISSRCATYIHMRHSSWASSRISQHIYTCI